MELGAILFSLAMILLVAAYVLQPLASSGRAGDIDTDQELSALQAERDRVLDSIQEVETDYSMGKVPEDDYQRQRNLLALQGAAILRSIDEISSNGTFNDSGEELEEAVAELRGASSVPDSQIAEADAHGTCPSCGEAIHHGDRFCSNCGEALEEQVA